MNNPNRWIMGAAIGLAVLAVAVDYMHHRPPESLPAGEIMLQEAPGYSVVEEEIPCTIDEAPCFPDEGAYSLQDEDD
jgi:hypothetical protein